MPSISGIAVSPLPSTSHRPITTQDIGFHIRHPPAPHLLSTPLTHDDALFQTTHMGAVTIDEDAYLLVVTGLVQRPFALTLSQLRALPSTSTTCVHECFGSPLTPATHALWRVGNVTWTGVPLRTLLALASPLPTARFVWTSGLDSGAFAGVTADCYQKDLPLSKAQEDGLVAWELGGAPLGRQRGGPVRLVVPGWFGTNCTKWLCKIELREERAPGPFTTVFYNVPVADRSEETKPVWALDVNSMIVSPAPGAVCGPEVRIEGWAWSCGEVRDVQISVDGGEKWEEARLETRLQFSWQKYELTVRLMPGEHMLMVRATAVSGEVQPLSEGRNHVHSVGIVVEE